MAISKVLDYKNLLAGFMIILVCLLTGCSEIEDIVHSYNTSVAGKPMYDIVCDDLAKTNTRRVFSNAFGRETKILKISNATEISRTGTSWEGNQLLVCSGEAKMSSGGDRSIVMTLEIDEDGDYWNGVEFP